MIKLYFIFILWVGIIFSSFSFASLRFISAQDSSLAWNGRVDRSIPDRVSYTWPSVYCRFITDSKILKVILNDSVNITKVLIDGVQKLEIFPQEGIKTNNIATNLSSGLHEVIIVKRTEVQWQKGEFIGILVDDSAKVLPKKSERRIEFLGDSFTVGYGNLANTLSCPGKAVWSNTDSWWSWAAITARHFNADFMINASSGKGLILNYGKSLPAVPEEAFFQEYKRTLQNNPDLLWEFDEQKPDLVVIFIGLNDFSTPWDDKITQPEDPKEKDWISEYLKIINMLRKKYKGVKFLCLGYPALGLDRMVFNMVSDQKKKKFKDIEYGLLPSLSKEDLGCDWHPAVSGHKKMAEDVIPVIKQFMQW